MISPDRPGVAGKTISGVTDNRCGRAACERAKLFLEAPRRRRPPQTPLRGLRGLRRRILPVVLHARKPPGRVCSQDFCPQRYLPRRTCAGYLKARLTQSKRHGIFRLKLNMTLYCHIRTLR